MKTIVLAGSGHAHLEVMQSLSKTELADHKFILISPHRQTYYSGLIPRFIAGEIDDTSLTINSADFAEVKGITYIQDSVKSIDSFNSQITLSSQKIIKFDLLSLNVGGELQKIPSESPLQTIYLRPFDEFMSKWPDVQKICSTHINPKFVVVGGGAAAVEVATALRIRLNKNPVHSGEVHVVSQGSRLCQNYSEKISASIAKSLLDFNIQVHLNEQVDEIDSKHIRLRFEKKLDFELIFVVTPTEPSKIVSEKIDSTLRISPNVFAVGDGTETRDQPKLPRSGVIAVHQGRHLILSIRNMLTGQNPTDFHASAKQLNILITGENSARLVWGGLSFEGAIPLKIKNWIDQQYMRKFKPN